jgi:hypothetical protein
MGLLKKIKYFLSKESLFWYSLYWVLFAGLLLKGPLRTFSGKSKANRMRKAQKC